MTDVTDVTVVGCTSCGIRPAVVARLCVQCATTALAERNALANRVDDLLHDIGVFEFAGIWVDGRDAESLRDEATTELYVALQDTRHQYLDLRDQRDAARVELDIEREAHRQSRVALALWQEEARQSRVVLALWQEEVRKLRQERDRAQAQLVHSFIPMLARSLEMDALQSRVDAAQAEMAQAELTLLTAARAVLTSADYDPDQARVDPDALEALETVCGSFPKTSPDCALGPDKE